MPLPSDEFRRRVVAAAALHGRGMRELRDLLEEFGTERTLAEAVIREEKPQNPRNIRDLAEALEVPRAWFTEPDWRPLIPGAGAAAQEPADPDAAALRTRLADAARQSDSSDRQTPERERGAANE